MCLHWSDRLRPALAALALLLAGAAQAEEAAPLRVCADPDNLPYSHEDGSGFEVRIAHILADALKVPLQLHWQPLRRGFVRKTLGDQVCDVLMGVPVGLERVLTTRPYYRSSYVFVARAGDAQPLASFDDSRLPQLRIGVQLIGNDLAASPPGYALARHGAVQRVAGFTIDGGEQPAAARMVQALARRELDAALVWGPQVGWFAAHAPVPMRVHVATPPADITMPFEFAISLGMRKGDTALRDRLQAALDARRADIDAVLNEYAVPRTDRPMPVASTRGSFATEDARALAEAPR
jgi:mxaJ protein